MDVRDDNEYRRQRAVEQAVDAVHRIISSATDGSNEETNYLMAVVAKKLMESALNPFTAALLKKDLMV
jgi:hypothetical protein